MKVSRETIEIEKREEFVHDLVRNQGWRLGLINSIDGMQILTLLLHPSRIEALILETPLERKSYPSLSRRLAAAHWHERLIWESFGLFPEAHPRLKKARVHNSDHSQVNARESRSSQAVNDQLDGEYQFLQVSGDGVFEVPVGPIHAGIIEPGHFHLSCLGEIVLNLEIRLGYVHRGVEAQITRLPWRKARFVAEAAASDSGAANALAFAKCIENISGIEPSAQVQNLRLLALEIERIGMHLADLSGIAADIGFLAVSTAYARARAMSFKMAELLSGHRYLRGFICPGGVARPVLPLTVEQIGDIAGNLEKEVKRISDSFFDNQGADERMRNVGKISHSLCCDFGLVGISARACGATYDARLFDPNYTGIKIQYERAGDVLARAKIRVNEILESLRLLRRFIAESPPLQYACELPAVLPANVLALSVVESHRGELIHMAITDHEGNLSRYCIKDSAINNWTGLAIAVRNNLLADFPLCNKSFALSYSGHDL